MKIAKTVLVALVVMMSAGLNQVFAQNHYSLVRIQNDTNETINYTFQWGNNPVHRITLSPGEERQHSWRYSRPNQNNSPKKTMTFDNWVGWKTTEHPTTYAVNNRQNQGKRYSLQFIGNRLVLVALN